MDSDIKIKMRFNGQVLTYLGKDNGTGIDIEVEGPNGQRGCIYVDMFDRRVRALVWDSSTDIDDDYTKMVPVLDWSKS
jgi:hypothetical protein